MQNLQPIVKELVDWLNEYGDCETNAAVKSYFEEHYGVDFEQQTLVLSESTAKFLGINTSLDNKDIYISPYLNDGDAIIINYSYERLTAAS